MRLHVSLIDFNELVVSFQKEFRVLSEENEVSFTFQLPDAAIMIWADKEKLSIVIRNIISNAFKFTPSGGSIHVVAGLTDHYRQHQRRRGKIRRGFLGEIGTAFLLRPYRLHLVRSPGE